MKIVTIDFLNKSISTKMDGQTGTMYCDIPKENLKSFFPTKNIMENYNSFTWDFENETLSANQTIPLPPGAIGIAEPLPEIIIPTQGLEKKYKEFLACIDFEEFSLEEVIKENFPELI